ncbi:MAG: deoxyribonuclease V [Oligoflexus sp.]
MQVKHVHSWDLAPSEAISLQKQLAKQIVIEDETVERSFRYVAACDVSFNRGDERLYAAIVVVNIRDGTVLEEVSADGIMKFPYIPGLLSFRELPIILQAFTQLKLKPDAIICDGQGIAHPRGLGIASHLGLWLDIPTIGCAKSLLCGKHESLAEERGATSPIYYREKYIGLALRTRKKVKPVYISPGHQCSFKLATDLVLKLATKYRLPDPIRMAHNLANDVRRNATLSGFSSSSSKESNGRSDAELHV